MSTRDIFWGVKAAGTESRQPYQLQVPIASISSSLNLLEPSGPLMACTRIVFTAYTGVGGGISLKVLCVLTFCSYLENTLEDHGFSNIKGVIPTRIRCNSGFFKNADIFIEGTVHTNPALINPYLHYSLRAEIPRLTAYGAGRDCSVDIVTGYVLDDPGIESRWGGGEIFRNRPHRSWGQLILCNGYRVSFREVKRPGAWR